MSEDIAPTLAGPLAALSLVPVDVAVSPAGAGRVLRVVVDRDVSGIDDADTSSTVAPLTLDEVAEATRIVGQTLDASDLMGERAYTLEVSSPGVGRPLRGYAALRRNVRRLVILTLASGSTLEGRLLAVSRDEAFVEVPGAKATGVRREAVPLSEVRSGTVQVEFTRTEDDDPLDEHEED